MQISDQFTNSTSSLIDLISELLSLFVSAGVFGYIDEVPEESVTVYEGESVTLHTYTVISDRERREIWWTFKTNDYIIPTTLKMFSKYSSFEERMQISERTGDLTIKNTRVKHTGLYEANIFGMYKKRFSVFVKESPRVIKSASDVTVSVTEGESVTLQTDVQIQKDDLILWRFGPDGVLIAKGDMVDNKISYIDADGRFRDRLMLDDQTGNLTITNITNKDIGEYQLKISSNGREIFYKTYSVSLRSQWVLSPLLGVVGVGVSLFLLIPAAGVALMVHYCCKISKVKRQGEKTVMEGYSVTLYTYLTKLKSDDVIKWRFRDQEIIAEINRKKNKISTYDGDDGRFRNRLRINNRTGDLTITNITTDHSGLYELKIISSKGASWSQFSVNVAAWVRGHEPLADVMSLLSGDSVNY
nr:uncharacterized protein LOC129452891 isoform X1 [Misgurnus anguillicaudatus]